MNMIEKVARASFKCWRDHMTALGHHMDKGQTFEDMSDAEREFALMNAKATIEAMREPTEEMLSVDFKNDFIVGEGNHDRLRRLITFQTMIDVALKD